MAVNKGTTSVSGKSCKNTNDLLAEIRGGSPSTTSLPFGIDGENRESVDCPAFSDNLDDMEDKNNSDGLYVCYVSVVIV